MPVLVETQRAQKLPDEQRSRAAGQAFAETQAFREPELKPGCQRTAAARQRATSDFRRERVNLTNFVVYPLQQGIVLYALGPPRFHPSQGPQRRIFDLQFATLDRVEIARPR